MCCIMLYSNDGTVNGADGTVANRSLPFNIIVASGVMADVIRHLFANQKKIAAKGPQ